MGDAFAHLNDQQRAAALADPDAPLLVLSAAGTGKTEVLTMRVVHLILNCGVPPGRVLAVTFSNRAAREMRERVARAIRAHGGSSEVPDGGGGRHAEPTVSTFHATCVRLLRMHPDYAEGFTILDSADATKALDSVIDDLAAEMRLKLETPRDTLKAAMALLNRWRNDGALAPEDVPPPAGVEGLALPPGTTPSAEQVAYLAFPRYRKACADEGAVDFADLLCHAVARLRRDADFRERVRRRWTHVLVDEYQDTNKVQLDLVLLLAGEARRVTAVGDDCQTIHEHAGADVARILAFGDAFPGATTTKLEMNFRSRAAILDAANRVVRENVLRTDKSLVCTRGEGPLGRRAVRVAEFADEEEEARAVAGEIARGAAAGQFEFRDVAVLYRINSLSSSIETALREAGVPYRMAGDVSFFVRAEVRDALAHLHAAVNPRSTQHVLRALRSFPCGVGPARIERLAAEAEAAGVDVPTAAAAALAGLKGRSHEGLKAFLAALAAVSHRPYRDAEVLARDCAACVARLARALEERHEPERAENVAALVSLVRRAAEAELRSSSDSTDSDSSPDSDSESGDSHDSTTVAAVLQRLELDQAGPEATDAGPDAVTLMSVHRSKGLEWPRVYVLCYAEGMLPFALSLNEKNGLEGERRLAYVALTRARESVVLTYPRLRVQWGRTVSAEPSRFVKEMGFKEEDVEGRARAQQRPPPPAARPWQHPHKGARRY